MYDSLALIRIYLTGWCFIKFAEHVYNDGKSRRSHWIHEDSWSLCNKNVSFISALSICSSIKIGKYFSDIPRLIYNDLLEGIAMIKNIVSYYYTKAYSYNDILRVSLLSFTLRKNCSVAWFFYASADEQTITVNEKKQ